MALAQRIGRLRPISFFGKRSRMAAMDVELSIPMQFRCPISLDLMKDPVTVPTGITYDRQSIETWLELGNRNCPVTNQDISGEELIPNHSVRRMIQDWCVENRSYGIERIPTPRIPITTTQASKILSEIVIMRQRVDCTQVHKLATKVKSLARESDRNRRCFVSTGASHVLANSFRLFASEPISNSTTGLLEDILSVMKLVFPLDEEACWHLRSPESLNSIVSILKCGNLEARLNAVLVLRQLVSLYKGSVEFVVETKGLVDVLVKLIREPISPQASKASLVVIYHLVSANEKTASRFVDKGLISLALEILVEDLDKSMCEKALAVLDSILSCEEGREKARNHALAVPVLVKKMFRVSDMATEFAVSALSKICKNPKKGEEREGEGCLVEALQVGAFQKLLLLLQVGCNGATKEKATELLKLLNGSMGSLECIDTTNFKGLRGPQ